MASIQSIPDMHARVLTIMATRSEDQDFVAGVAGEHGVSIEEDGGLQGRVIPAFGWHPWFSHQLYDDSLPADKATFDTSAADVGAQKQRHYRAVLRPAPAADFVDRLPDPVALTAFLAATRARLRAHPLALVGEVGLDKAFRLPQPWTAADQSARDGALTPGGRERRPLSAHRVTLEHQSAVLAAQLRLAGELGRAVSLHSVQAPGALYNLLRSLWKGHEREVLSRRQLKMVAERAEDWSDDPSDDEGNARPRGSSGPKPFPPRICLHSYSGPAQMMKQFLDPTVPVRFYFSFSVAINTYGGEDRLVPAVQACPDDQLLIESDLHCAGEEMDGYLEDMHRRVCEIKGWSLREGAERIRKNYFEFIHG